MVARDDSIRSTVVDVERSTDVREVVEAVQREHPEVELSSRRPRERPLKTRQTFLATVEDELTDRQLEVLRTAYLSGYFESPRVTTGKELSDLLDVSQPTFSQHLRGGRSGRSVTSCSTRRSRPSAPTLGADHHRPRYRVARTTELSGRYRRGAWRSQ